MKGFLVSLLPFRWEDPASGGIRADEGTVCSLWVIAVWCPRRGVRSRQGLPLLARGCPSRPSPFPRVGDAAQRWWRVRCAIGSARCRRTAWSKRPDSLGKPLRPLLAFPGGSSLKPQMQCKNRLASCFFKWTDHWQQKQNGPRVGDAVT